MLALAAALVIAAPAFADITLTFSAPVNVVSFYSSEPFNLTYSDNSGFSTTVNSGYTFGAVTAVGTSGVTSVDFSGTPNFYVLDNFVYSVGGATYTMAFDETILQNCGCSIGGFYAAWAGSPVWSHNADVLTYPNYNYPGYPYLTYPDVIYEGGTAPSPTPEPGTLVMLGSGLIGVAGVIRRKLSA